MKGSAGTSVRTQLCDLFGVDYPVFGFTHCREVVVAISRAGGMGVYGAAYFSPEQVEEDVAWIRARLDGRPFGVDVMIPSRSEMTDARDLDKMAVELEQRIPEPARAFVEQLLERFGVPPVPDGAERTAVYPLGPSAAAARQHIDAAISGGACLVVSALGAPPREAVEAAHERGVKVGGMVGAVHHVRRQLDAGVDLIIAQGSEAAAHAGDVSTMVLVPEVVDAVGPLPVLAAGGIASGRQFLAARALGAQGIWTGSMWRVAAENTERAGVVNLLLEASSSDTVRSRCMTGKELRQLRSEWNDAWAEAGAPAPLPMPLQRILTTDAEQRIVHHHRDALVVSPIGQVVGQLRQVRPAADLMSDLVTGFAATARDLDL